MADYGRDLEFGASVAPLADPPDFAQRVSVAADRAGLDRLNSPGGAGGARETGSGE